MEQQNESTKNKEPLTKAKDSPTIEEKIKAKKEAKPEAKKEAAQTKKETELVPKEAKPKTKTPIWAIVLMVVLGVGLIAAIIGIFSYRKRAKIALADLEKIKSDFK